MKALQVFLIRHLVACPTFHPLLYSLLPSFGMGIILDLGVAIRTGEFAMNRLFISSFGHKKRDIYPTGILLYQRFILMTVEAKGMVAPSYSSR
jgi:hypothetical protein